ncbi:DUF3667 domain-containing protein [Sphingomonas changnyeongensis]|nr:DUF3667 domain-containing protein [Sphingomonas changnyeongensis]
MTTAVGMTTGAAGDAGQAASPHGVCANCGTVLAGAYCHGCGQAAHVHRSLAAIWHDLAHGVLHFEGRIWSTLPLLAWHPGALTRRYIAGERVRFVSPMALFLFSVFLLFAVFGALGMELNVIGGDRTATASAAAATSRDGLAAARHDLDARIAAARARGGDTAALEQERAMLSMASGIVEPGGNGLQISTGLAAIDARLKKASANPGLLLYKIQSSAYKLSWALIPISTPLLWLLFAWRREYRLYDHAVFVTYSLAFMSLLAVVLAVLGSLPVLETAVVTAATLVPPVHMYRQMRGAYGLSRRNALLRTGLLLILALFALTMFAFFLVALGALG